MYIQKFDMAKILFFKRAVIFLLTTILANSCSEKASEEFDFVRPNLGSVHSRWFFYTPGAVPFGMVKLAPSTNGYGSFGSWGPCGYDDHHTSIEGFAHFHEFQIGGYLVMPTTGKLKTLPGSLAHPDSGFRSRFDKKSEIATPGYYSVLLKDYDIKAELTASERVGYQRYTFPESADAHILFDVGHKMGESGEVVRAEIKYEADGHLEGFIETYPEYAKFCDPGKHVKMFFYTWINKKPENTGAYINDSIIAGVTESKGTNNGLYLTFNTQPNEVVELITGVSYTSIQNARLNFETESKNKPFDIVRSDTRKKWQDMLGRIRVTGGTENDKVKFYTGLYHALLGRGISSDVNGEYPLNNGGIGSLPLGKDGKPTHNHHNTDAVWGAFWNLGPLWALAYPDVYSNMVNSAIDFYSETSWLHDGEAAGVYTNGVQTNFTGLMIAAAYNCGIRDFDIQRGYAAALKNELSDSVRHPGIGRYDNEYFIRMGYVPLKDYFYPNGWLLNFGASHTLEYSFGAFAVSQMAKSLGHEDDYQKLKKYSDSWRLLFDKESKFVRPKEMDGTFLKDFDPMRAWHGFQEGNAFQYTWYVPHDVKSLIHEMGKEEFNRRLALTFEESAKTGFGGGKDSIGSFSGIEKLYNHGNQPCLHNPWLFNYSGKPWLTQKWVNAICNEFYGTDGLHGYGYGQDEDQGQLGAWFVLAAMGLFDLQGHAAANPSFQISSPLFDKIEIELHPKYYNGQKVEIITRNKSSENIYIQSALLNGKTLDNCWFYRNELIKGGKLEIDLGPQPNQNWGINKMPPSMSDN